MTTRLISITQEPLTVAEVKVQCRIDSDNAEPAPDAPVGALAGAGAGNVDNGAHRYRVTFVTASGETEGGTISEPVVVADKTADGRVALTGIPTGGGLVTARKLYRTAAGGAAYLLLATIADNSTTAYTDNIADSGLGGEAPAVNSTDDPQLLRLISAARQAAEQALGRSIALATWETYLDEFPDEIKLQWPPILTVASVTYIDEGGAPQVLDPSLYSLDNKSEPGWLLPPVETSWPATQAVANAVTVRYTAGYGASCPDEIKQWMLLVLRAMYDNPAGKVELSEFVDRLLDRDYVPAL